MLDLVEEPLHEIPGSIEMRAKADRIVAIATRRNVGPCAPLGCKRSDPVRIIAPVGEQHCSRLQASYESSGETVIVRLNRSSAQRAPADHSYRPPRGFCWSTRRVIVPSIVFCSA